MTCSSCSTTFASTAGCPGLSWAPPWQDVTADMAEAFGLPRVTGAIVAEVTPNTPAARAALAIGDIVIRIGDRDIPNLRAATRAIAGSEIDSPTTLTVLRNGASMVLPATIVEAGGETPRINLDMTMLTMKRITARNSPSKAKVNPELRRKYGIKSGIAGVVLIKVAKNGLGAYLRLRRWGSPDPNPGHSGDQRRRSYAHSERALEQKRERVAVLIQDSRGTRWITVPITQ